MTKQVGFEFQRYDTADITIVEVDENRLGIEEVDDYELFQNIIDSYGDAIDDTGPFYHDFNGKHYRIDSENYKEDTTYIGFEVY